MRSKLIIIVLCLLTLTGCWDKVELENRDFVLVLSIDKGTEHRYAVSLSIADEDSLSGGGLNPSIKQAEGGTVADAVAALDAQSGKKLYFGHTKAVIIGYELLQNTNMLMETSDYLERGDFSGKIRVLVSDGDAGKVLHQKENEPLVGMLVTSFFQNKAQDVSVTLERDLEGFLTSLRATGCALLPKITQEDDIQIGGLCVIKNFAAAGFLDDKETEGCLWLLGEAKGARLTVEHDGGYLSFKVRDCGEKITFSEGSGGLECVISVNAAGVIEGSSLLDDLTKDNMTNTENKTQKYEAAIESQIYAAFKTMQSSLQTDGAVFLNILRKSNYPLYEKYGDNGLWEQSFADMKITASASVEIVNTGKSR